MHQNSFVTIRCYFFRRNHMQRCIVGKRLTYKTVCSSDEKQNTWQTAELKFCLLQSSTGTEWRKTGRRTGCSKPWNRPPETIEDGDGSDVSRRDRYCRLLCPPKKNRTTEHASQQHGERTLATSQSVPLWCGGQLLSVSWAFNTQRHWRRPRKDNWACDRDRQLIKRIRVNYILIITYHKPARSMRSSASHSLSVARHLSFGSGAFCISALKIWNSLPPYILQSQTLSSFRRHLKTHYFSVSPPCPLAPIPNVSWFSSETLALYKSLTFLYSYHIWW